MPDDAVTASGAVPTVSTRYTSRRACRLASANTSAGPETSSICTPGGATMTIVRGGGDCMERNMAEIAISRQIKTERRGGQIGSPTA